MRYIGISLLVVAISGATLSFGTKQTLYMAVGLPFVGPILTGGQPRNQMVVAPASATFRATAAGTEPISYQWNKNGVAIPGACSATYTTPATSLADNGATFTVTVTNRVNGFTSAPAALTVQSVPIAPTIVTQPRGISVSRGNTASFHAFAEGSGPLAYQWRKNGTPIRGATEESYTTPAAADTDNHSHFSFMVTNAAGATTSIEAGLAVTPQAFGLGGFAADLANAPKDITGTRFRFKVVTNRSHSEKIIFNNHTLGTPGTSIVYNVESNVYAGTQTFGDGGCTTWPLLGSYKEAQASLRNAVPDYPFARNQQPAVGSSMHTSDPARWPVQTYLIDGMNHNVKSDSISQFGINGLEGFVTLERGATVPNAAGFERCGKTMLPGPYRMWTITTQMAGRPALVNEIILPDAHARYILASAAMEFYSEFLSQPGTFAVQYWDLAFSRESNPNWIPVSTFRTSWNYDGNGRDFGVRVVSVDGHDRIEFSNAAGNLYLPGNLTFSIAPP